MSKTSSFTPDQVLALAPDPGSAKSGKDLAAARKWATLGANDRCAWGTIQGSGKDPYQTSIDLSGPAFKCSCPSRKFPCKHGLGLFLILTQQPGAMKETSPPAWTSEWLAKRVEQEEKKAAKISEPPVVDPEAEAKAAAAAEKRAASRETKVTAGLDEMGVWLCDLVRTGFASLPGKTASFWETPAARLVDAQAPGLARRVLGLDGITTTGERWPARLLREVALLHLAREGWSRISSLPPPAAADLRAVLGFTASQDEVMASPGVRDEWVVIGQIVEEEERLRTQRTWLFGSLTKRPALCLSFSASPSQPFDINLLPGTVVDAEMAFFPGSWPLRALVKQKHGAAQTAAPRLPHESVAAASAFASEALAANPWLERVPFALDRVTPFRQGQGWCVCDEGLQTLPLVIPEMKAWSLLAIAGGKPISLAGEWNGEMLRPLSVWAEGRFLRVS